MMTWTDVAFLALLLGGFFMAWRAVKPFLERHATVAEKKVDAAIEATKPAPVPVPNKHAAMPATIRMMAMDWQDEWAREQTLDFYSEIYDQTQDWNAVMSMALADQARLLKAKGELH